MLREAPELEDCERLLPASSDEEADAEEASADHCRHGDIQEITSIQSQTEGRHFLLGFQ
jgi:hypothetical protein